MIFQYIYNLKFTYKTERPASRCALLLALLGFGSPLLAQVASDRLNASVDTVYPVLLGTRPDSTNIASIGFIKGKPLRAVPISSVNNTLAGRIAGLEVTQVSGQPGNDYGSFLLRGQTPIVLVDGVPRNPTSVLPDHVESVTVLKDALATAALGVRGANGAILITTRKGSKGQDAFDLDIAYQTGVTAPLKMRTSLPAYQYATLYNEALANDGIAPVYSVQDIEKYKNGADPYYFPDHDWKDILMKNQARFKRYSLNIEGSSKGLSYFVATDYLNQDGLFKQSDQNTYSTNADFSRFGFRGNVAFDIDSRMSMELNLYGSAQKRNSPGGSIGLSFAPNSNRITINSGSVSNIFSAMLNTPANAYPVLNEDGSFGGNRLYSNNLWGQLVGSGYSQNNNNDAFADLVLKRDMGDLIKGWWIKGIASYTMEIGHSIFRNKNFKTFQMLKDPTTDGTSSTQFGANAGFEQANTSSVQLRNGMFFSDFSTGIKRTSGQHQIDLAVNYQFNSARYGNQLPFVVHNGILSANYQYANRYLVDLVASYSGNNWYQKEKQYDLYPSVGLGWNVHNESFFDIAAIDKLKIRTSYGVVGSIDANYYSYLYTYSNYAGAYMFGTGMGAVQGTTEGALPYARVPEKARKLNLGTDIEFLNNRAVINVDYYYNNNFDNLVVRGESTGLLGAIYPSENLGKALYKGFETNVGWTDQLGAFHYYLGGNIAFQSSKVLENAQLPQLYSWMEKKGEPVNQMYGYITDGFVSSPGDGPVVAGYRSVPGDLKYQDLNGDGIINQYDITAIGSRKPAIIYGFSTRVNYKGFDLNVLFQGVANRQIMLSGAGEWEFQNNGLGAAFEQHLNRWTPETATTATYPRLTAGTNVNNHVSSDFWIQSADYLRLKTAELGYTFSGNLLKRIGISQMRIFTTGFNLWTSSNVKRFDPESASYDYPLVRMFNGGVSVKF